MSEKKVTFDYESNGLLFGTEEQQEPVTCLGIEFPSDKKRREYFIGLLREKLNDPEFRAIEGFPLGDDEAILELSDPPYYCACPNPWIPELMAEWEEEKPKKPSTWVYQREPFAADVSEGKNHPIYNAHSYHTKVPHRAIMRYILHYTEPGDIVFDGFCGTGMTGVAAQLCGDRSEVEALGYKVTDDGTIYQKELDSSGREIDVPFSKLGARKAVLNDLSPAATFIAYNYNSPVDIEQFQQEADAILDAVEKECGWMYETTASDGRKAKINYTVWSDVFICPECSNEVVFYDEAVNKEDGKVLSEFPCPHCQTLLTKRNMTRSTETSYDPALKRPITMAKQVPVLINYSTKKQRGDKRPDVDDLALIKKIHAIDIPCWYPTAELPDGFNTRQPKLSHSLNYVHQFYSKRNLYILSRLMSKEFKKSTIFKFLLSSINTHISKMRRWQIIKPGGTPGLPGTLFVSSVSVELSPFDSIPRKQDFIKRALDSIFSSNIISTCSSTGLISESNSMDYIFLDPPFGANLNYSELSFIWEAWLRVITNNKEEAIKNIIQRKGINEYRVLMKACFAEAFRVLKPGRWMTVEFSNTDSAVWNSIQTSLSDVGFIVANVSALDKQQGSFKAVTTTKAVKQDLVISLYKPDETFERQIKQAVGEEQVWTFVRKHLSYLPLVKRQGDSAITVPERDPRIIFDRVVAYFIGQGMLLPVSSGDFLAAMPQRFVERDGLYYLADQVAEYDKMKARQQVKIQEEAAELFVSDEASAIAWLRYQLKQKPMTLGELTPLFLQELSGWSKNESRLELSELLDQNFLCYEMGEDVPPAIHSYLSTNFKDMRNLNKNNPHLQTKAKGRWYLPDPNRLRDLDKLRERALLKEFEVYKTSKGKLKEFRIEAVRAGFRKAWQEKDYKLIQTISERMPSAVVEEDEKLLLWYNGAMTRLGL
jgi:DNA modification methylase